MKRLRSLLRETGKSLFPEGPSADQVEVANLAVELDGFFVLNGTLRGKSSTEEADIILAWWRRANRMLEKLDPTDPLHLHLREAIDDRHHSLIDFYYQFCLAHGGNIQRSLALRAMIYGEGWTVFNIALKSSQLPKYQR